MPLTRKTLTAALFALCATCALAATPSKRDALLAISVLEKSVVGPEASEAAKTIVIYAQLSEDVMVDIGPDQLPWLSESFGLDKDQEAECHSILLAAFVAGNIKSQIKNDKAEDDTYSGWLFAIQTYRRLQAQEDFKSPSIEALARMQADGTLLKHAKDVQQSLQQQEDQDMPRKPAA
ncbi:MAG TPA: hypothetical protein VII09_06795 [Opitutaceae bacterium]